MEAKRVLILGAVALGPKVACRLKRPGRVKSRDSGRAEELPYDYLVLATGSRPRTLTVPGADLPGVMTESAGGHLGNRRLVNIGD